MDYFQRDNQATTQKPAQRPNTVQLQQQQQQQRQTITQYGKRKFSEVVAGPNKENTQQIRNGDRLKDNDAAHLKIVMQEPKEIN